MCWSVLDDADFISGNLFVTLTEALLYPVTKESIFDLICRNINFSKRKRELVAPLIHLYPELLNVICFQCLCNIVSSLGVKRFDEVWLGEPLPTYVCHKYFTLMEVRLDVALYTVRKINLVRWFDLNCFCQFLGPERNKGWMAKSFVSELPWV